MGVGDRQQTANDLDGIIHDIARALWDGGGRSSGGRAAVMIGSGFSRNAVPRKAVAREFPLWRDLVRALIDNIQPPCASCSCLDDLSKPLTCEQAKRRRYLAEGTQGASGMMRLGQMFEADTSRARLEGVLTDAIPNKDYDPGTAHQLLVRLPWADIFTTNWDTLLERAVDAYDRSYMSVNQPGQIAITSSPRIVKLHGSLEAGTRLIFTEEDFRTYPQRYAPFVTLVQSTIMDSILVLVGFSGEDPNFLVWHGWARDQMQDHLQRIYVVLNETPHPAELALLRSRRITPVDISKLAPGKSYQGSLEEFLSQLHAYKSRFADLSTWPSEERRSARRHAPTFDDQEVGKPDEALQKWERRLRAQRSSSLVGSRPEWLVLPWANRNDLILRLTYDFEPIEKLLFEVGQRRRQVIGSGGDPGPSISERAAIVLAGALEFGLAGPKEAVRRGLERVFQRLVHESLGVAIGGEGLAFLAGLRTPEDCDSNWRAGLDLLNDNPNAARTRFDPFVSMISLLEREARYAGRADYAAGCRHFLRALHGEGEHKQTAAYADVLAALHDFDVAKAREKLNEWRPSKDEPTWSLRKAALLLELGEYQEAERETYEAVMLLRNMSTQREPGLWVLSREAWAYWAYQRLLEIQASAPQSPLAHFVELRPGSLSVPDIIVELTDRLDELSGRKCDPRREFDHLGAALEKAELLRKLKHGGSAPNSSGVAIVDAPMTLMRLTEAAGLWLRTPGHNRDILLSACRGMASGNPSLALRMLARGAVASDLDPRRPISGRELEPQDDTMAILAEEPTRKPLFEEALKWLSELTSREIAEPFLIDTMALLVRLCRGLARQDDEWRRLSDTAQKLHDSSSLERLSGVWVEIDDLFEGLIEWSIAQGGDVSVDLLRSLLGLRTPQRPNEARADWIEWPDPFKLLTSPASGGAIKDVSVASNADQVLSELGKRFVAAAHKSARKLGSRDALKKRAELLASDMQRVDPEVALLLGRRNRVLASVFAPTAR